MRRLVHPCAEKKAPPRQVCLCFGSEVPSTNEAGQRDMAILDDADTAKKSEELVRAPLAALVSAVFPAYAHGGLFEAADCGFLPRIPLERYHRPEAPGRLDYHISSAMRMQAGATHSAQERLEPGAPFLLQPLAATGKQWCSWLKEVAVFRLCGHLYLASRHDPLDVF